jgi:hypothetical protein
MGGVPGPVPSGGAEGAQGVAPTEYPQTQEVYAQAQGRPAKAGGPSLPTLQAEGGAITRTGRGHYADPGEVYAQAQHELTREGGLGGRSEVTL